MGVQQDFRTKDLYFAAFLKARGVELLDAQRHGSVVYFVFEMPPNERELRNDYFGGEGEVAALAYADAVRNLKALLHEI